MDSKILYGCCVGNWDKFQRYVVMHDDTPMMALAGQKSISVAYNKIISSAFYEDVDALVLLHDDLEILDPDNVFEQRVLEAVAEPDVALVGVAGGGPSMAWWNIDPIGHQLTDSGMLEFGGRRTGDVDMIEGSLMILSRWAIKHLRFDERYEFLGYDDICLEARRWNKRVVVADIDTYHHSTVGYKSESVREMWERSEEIFRSKWGGNA